MRSIGSLALSVFVRYINLPPLNGFSFPPSPVSLASLREQLAKVLDDTKPGTPALPTGIAALDAALPGHGLPRGRLTELLGAPGCGKTTLVRRMVERAMSQGWWVAYVDATRTLAPREWAPLGAGEGLWMVRPRAAERGAWCADVLLRSGAFALVVLDGAPMLSREVAVRLTRLARESDAALLLLGDDTKASALGGALRLRVARARSGGTSIAPRDALGPLRGPAAASRETTLVPPSPRIRASDGVLTARADARATPVMHPPRTDARATPVLHIIAPHDARGADDTGVTQASARTDGAREGPVSVFERRPQDREAVREPRENGYGVRPSGEKTRIMVTIEKGGPYQTVNVGEVDRDIAVARRVRAHPEIPDRRGVARQQRRAPGIDERNGGEGGSTESGHAVSTRINARSRRCAEAKLPDEPFLAEMVER